MPGVGDRSMHDCPDCGEPMFWSEASVQRTGLLAGGLSTLESGSQYADAYRCARGHTGKQCPLCGSYETAAWVDREDPSHYHAHETPRRFARYSTAAFNETSFG
jgi:hypothetical protein